MINCHTLQSTVNVGLVVGVSVSAVVLLILIGIPACIGIGFCCVASKRNYPVQTRVMTTTPSAPTNTVVTSDQAGTPFSAPAPDPHLQQNVYEGAQWSCQNAPPSYFEATAFPQAAEVTNIIKCTV